MSTTAEEQLIHDHYNPICANCGTKFFSQRGRAIYCSRKCNQKAAANRRLIKKLRSA